jgi:hypothetical protein
MPAFDFPASPVAGDTVTNSDSGITYQYQSGGYWRSIKYSRPTLDPPIFTFRQVGPAPNDLTKLCEVFVPDGYRIDLSTFEYSLSANPATEQVFDILVNNVRASDTITVSTGGVVTINDPRGPYIGPLELQIYLQTGETPEPGFGTLVVTSPIEVV